MAEDSNNKDSLSLNPRPKPNDVVKKNNGDNFTLVDLYPDAASLLAHIHAPIAEVVQNGMVALDASVLLYAYEFKTDSLVAVDVLP